MAMNLVKLPTGKSNLQLRVSKGHYATSHSHINYYIDVTLTKFRLSEARAAAAELVREYKSTTIVDTILCLDGTEVIGACMASELTKAGYTNMNAHQTIYVVTPEHTTGSQLLFRENTAPMIAGKHVLVLAASVTTGFTVQGAVEAIRYYSFEGAKSSENLQARVAEAVDKRINFLALPAPRAAVGVVGFVIRKVVGVKDAGHGVACALLDRRKDR